MNRYEAVLYVRKVGGDYQNGKPVGRGFKTVASAGKAATKALRRHPSQETRAGSYERFPAYVEIIDRKTGRKVAEVEAERVLVPSVGELGHW